MARPGKDRRGIALLLVLVMATLLTWVAATHSAWRGFSYLFVFSLGMSALLVAVGLTAGNLSKLPRAGLWMVRVKTFFAVVMLGAAENKAPEPVLPVEEHVVLPVELDRPTSR